MAISGLRIKDAEPGAVAAEENIGRAVVVEVANVEVIVEGRAAIQRDAHWRAEVAVAETVQEVDACIPP